MRPTLLLSAALLLSGAVTAHSPRRHLASHLPASVQERSDAAEIAPELEARQAVEQASKGFLAARKSSLGAPEGVEPVRGVSLGGWLVLEAFIVPSVFDATGPVSNGIIDEWTFASKQPKAQATRILQKHLNTFITQQDMYDIKAAGLNLVRIPIGYWAFDIQGNEPYLKLNQWNLLKQAVMWAANAGLQVMPELHGAPGSQNPFDHSGQKQKNQHWTDKKSNIDRALAIIRTMAVEFSKSKYQNAVVALELLNEPLVATDVLKRYYSDGYRIVREQSDMLVVLSDGFNQAQFAGWQPAEDAKNVAYDSHIYTIFADDKLRWSAATRQSYYCKTAAATKQANAKNNAYSLFGEWTPTFHDCATYLNGRGVGSRYDGTFDGSTRYGSCADKRGDGSKFSTKYKKLLARFWAVQRDAYGGDDSLGWIMWTWKTENNGDWSYKAGLQYGWIPKDAANGSVSDFRC